MRIFKRLLVVALAFVISGCGYSMGSLLPSDLKTVAVPTFTNKTSEPNIEIDVTRGVIDEFNKDGTLNVVDKEKADTLLEAEIISYEKVVQTYDSQGTPEQSKLVITVNIRFENLKTGEVIALSTVQGEAKFDIGVSQFESERAILPDAVKDLSQHIVEKVVEGGW